MSFDNGPAEVLVLLAGQGTIDTSELLLPGGATAEVFLDEEDNMLVHVGVGSATSEELVRAVLRSPHCQITQDPVDIVVQCAGGYDRFVYSADLQHEFLFTRQWEQQELGGGPSVVLIGQAPVETQDRSGDAAAHARLEGVVKLVEGAVGRPGQLHVVNLFTRRMADGGRTDGSVGGRRGDTGIRTDTLHAADAIVAAWGPVLAAGLWAVDEIVEELRECRDGGSEVLVPAVGGRANTAGDPPQPSMPARMDGAHLVDAPADWLWGAPLGM